MLQDTAPVVVLGYKRRSVSILISDLPVEPGKDGRMCHLRSITDLSLLIGSMKVIHA
jgi:hypothetical protein